MLYESIRTVQENLINQNPTSIVISRTTRTQGSDGGYTEDTADLYYPQIVRIYNKRTRVLNVDEGGYHSQRITRMIAEYDADLKAESDTYLDTFTDDNDKTYKIVDVKDITTQGQIVFKECELEEIV